MQNKVEIFDKESVLYLIGFGAIQSTRYSKEIISTYWLLMPIHGSTRTNCLTSNNTK